MHKDSKRQLVESLDDGHERELHWNEELSLYCKSKKKKLCDWKWKTALQIYEETLIIFMSGHVLVENVAKWLNDLTF